MKAQKGNDGIAIRRRELIMNHLNPTHSWYATPKGKREKKINSSQYKSHWLLSIDTVSIFCWDLSYIKCHSTHKLLFFTFSAVVPSPSPAFFSIAHIFKCLHWNLSWTTKKKLMMGCSVMKKIWVIIWIYSAIFSNNISIFI